MTKIYDAIVSNGILIKGGFHTNESLKKLNIYDFCFVDDKLHQVVGFDENKNPQLANGDGVFAITKEIVRQYTPEVADGLKLQAHEDLLEKYKKEIAWKVKVNNFS